MTYACIFAGGRGTRMGGNIPKQYLPLDGIPVIVRTATAFAKTDGIDEIIAAVPVDYIDYTKKLFAEYSLNVTVIEGGKSRNGTLLKFLDYIKDEDGILITHDAARAFITPEIISECIRSMDKFQASTVAIAETDSVALCENGLIKSYLKRAQVVRIQTPQTFDLRSMRAITQGMSEESLDEYTDCAAIFTAKGYQVGIVNGSRNNIKITYPEDLM